MRALSLYLMYQPISWQARISDLNFARKELTETHIVHDRSTAGGCNAAPAVVHASARTSVAPVVNTEADRTLTC
jgi:hypothetical protein